MPMEIHEDKIVMRAGKYDLEPRRGWADLMRGVRVQGDTVIVSVKGGNEAARLLCEKLVEEMNK